MAGGEIRRGSIFMAVPSNAATATGYLYRADNSKPADTADTGFS